ncbi:MAG: GNAT family N-acetyltransferase [Woeseiaceae bacterium]|nr:GNAT family N-acetyltransferase [Woeseiaceae bacterium]
MTLRIRQFRDGDEAALLALFRNTIRNVNRRDYSAEQVRAWAPDDIDPQHWQRRIRGIDPFVCESDGRIVGYADVQDNGYIDHFFVHHETQGQGVGKTLFAAITQKAGELGIAELTSEVSITARPFFEHMGFDVVRSQVVTMNDVELTNFRMRKAL